VKQFCLSLCLALVMTTASSQSCETREAQLLGAIGSFSATSMYNTYALIGAIGDGFGADVYDVSTANAILVEQEKLLDNLVKVLTDLNKGKYLAEADDSAYAASAVTVLTGLKKQSQLLREYTKDKTQKKLDAFEAQRTTNWKKISELMGIDD
jgi:hypothetical protein